ncbi:hypothetical protein HQ520_09775 [bacterium]|nr:hypothetical protein [bacterium]
MGLHAASGILGILVIIISISAIVRFFHISTDIRRIAKSQEQNLDLQRRICRQLEELISRTGTALPPKD